MPSCRTRRLLVVATMCAACLAARDATAQPARARDLTIYVGSGPGGAYDTYARYVSRHLGRHLPDNPNVIVSHMPGAAGRRMIAWLYNIAPKDGSAIGTALSTLAFDALLGEASQFDALKLNWLGSANKETSVCIMWHASPIKSLEDVKVRPARVGASGPSSTDAIYAHMMNSLFGTKFAVIHGFTSAPAMNLAIEQGELDGRCGLTWTSLQSLNASWMKAGLVRVILQVGLEKHAGLPSVPYALDLARSEEQRQIITLWAAPNQMGRPYFAPPGVSAERVEILRRGFQAMSRNPAYKTDGAAMGLGSEPMTGEEVEALVRQVYATPQDVVEKAGRAARGS